MATINILIVEDEKDILDYCARTIEAVDSSIVVHPVSTAEDALVLLNTIAIDGVFIDIELPGMSGFDFARNIRERDDYHLLPIVFATGTDNNSVETYRTYHNYDYIAKPFDVEKLIKATKKLLAEIDSVKRAIVSEKTKVIKVSSPTGVCFVEINSILFVHKKLDKVIIVTDDSSASYFIRQSLEGFAKYINDFRFLQCNKSTIINISRIKKYKQRSAKTWDLFFDSNRCEKCELSYLYHQEVLEAIENKIK